VHAIMRGATWQSATTAVCFELTVMALDRLKIIAHGVKCARSREDAIASAAKHNNSVTATSKSIFYSRGTQTLCVSSHEGFRLKTRWNEPEEVMYQISTSCENAPEIRLEYVGNRIRKRQIPVP